MRRWFGDESITAVHGSIRNIGHGVACYVPPAAALRNPSGGGLERDMQKLPPLIQEGAGRRCSRRAAKRCPPARAAPRRSRRMPHEGSDDAGER